MFDTLLSSNPAKRPGAVHAGLSLLAHAGLVTGAVAATRGMAPAPPPAPVQVTMVLPVSPPTPPVPPVSVPAPPGGVPSGPVFETVTPPAIIPLTIPPIDLGQRFDPNRFTGRGVQVPPRTPAGTSGSEPVPPLWSEHEVDQPVGVVRPPVPRYPPALRQAGLAGFVVVQFVVDTLGRVEAGSVAILESSHPHFEDAARDAVLAARFRPARIRGVAVRQLVQQRIRFSISP